MEPAVARVRTWIRNRIVTPVIGARAELPRTVAERWPELASVRWRRGGLPVRIGGWCLGRASVDGITLWRTVFLAPGASWEPTLLLHEHRHVEQFASSAVFPFLYVWETLTRGYARNRFEADADAWAATRLRRSQPVTLSQGA
ncbi:MAG TPA: hypothetical protein VE861_14040 [Gemmatimonadaceae bacterium]|nr:hypothetical protein [Gemmatimonadaceae bacterium]